MKKIKKDLQVVSKEFDALTKKTKKLTNELKKKAADQLDRTRAAVKPELAARKTAQALKSFSKTMDKMLNAVEKFEKEQAAKKKPKAAAKKKTAKKAPAKKKAAAKKKGAAVSATDQVLNIIKRSKKGVDAPTLVKKTGFEDTKIRNILFRTLKQGKIKRAGRGVYIGM
ncbi:MAG: hypothetical protein HWN68_16795 [Desulfobacterales bacterium]|nr:hypothetical protein [Desulfobacterales bacterium]